MPAKAKQKAMPRAAVSDVTPAAMAPGEQEVGHEEGHGDDAAPLAKPKRNRKPDKRKGSRRKKQLPGSSVCLPPGHRAKPNSGKHATDKKRASGKHKRGTRGENAWARLSSKVTDGCKPGPDWAAEVTRLTTLNAKLYQMLDEQNKRKFREHAEKTGLSRYVAKRLFGRA